MCLDRHRIIGLTCWLLSKSSKHSRHHVSCQRVSCHSFNVPLDIFCQVSHTATQQLVMYEHQLALLCKQCPPEYRTSSWPANTTELTVLHVIACSGTNTAESCVNSSALVETHGLLAGHCTADTCHEGRKGQPKFTAVLLLFTYAAVVGIVHRHFN